MLQLRLGWTAFSVPSSWFLSFVYKSMNALTVVGTPCLPKDAVDWLREPKQLQQWLLQWQAW